MKTKYLEIIPTVQAGFPSPAENYLENTMDLNKVLVKNPSSTFFARVSGDSMIDDGVDNEDLLIIDKSVAPYDGCLAVCFLDGEFTLKRVKTDGNTLYLVPANKKYPSIKVDANNDFLVWGVVKYIIKRVY